jgi:hypothetical protein
MADLLAEINGIKPKVLLKDGEDREMSSMTRCVKEFGTWEGTKR